MAEESSRPVPNSGRDRCPDVRMCHSRSFIVIVSFQGERKTNQDHRGGEEDVEAGGEGEEEEGKESISGRRYSNRVYLSGMITCLFVQVQKKMS